MTSSGPTFPVGGDIPVRRLGFGAMRITGPGIWGPPPDRAAARALLHRAAELGRDGAGAQRQAAPCRMAH